MAERLKYSSGVRIQVGVVSFFSYPLSKPLVPGWWTQCLLLRMKQNSDVSTATGVRTLKISQPRKTYAPAKKKNLQKFHQCWELISSFGLFDSAAVGFPLGKRAKFPKGQFPRLNNTVTQSTNNTNGAKYLTLKWPSLLVFKTEAGTCLNHSVIRRGVSVGTNSRVWRLYSLCG